MTLKLPLPNERRVIGRTITGLEVFLHCHGSGRWKALLIGGVHGDEKEGFYLAERYLQALQANEVSLQENLQLYICPRLNPDGCVKLRRTNHHNVDLNRNLPSKDWNCEFTNVRYYPGVAPASEIESKLTVKLIEDIQPKLIISLHSYKEAMINYNGPCKDLAQAMSAHNGLPAKDDIGYSTPGSLGTYAGWERNIPTITLEILRGQGEHDVWQAHHKALTHAFAFYLNHNE